MCGSTEWQVSARVFFVYGAVPVVWQMSISDVCVCARECCNGGHGSAFVLSTICHSWLMIVSVCWASTVLPGVAHPMATCSGECSLFNLHSCYRNREIELSISPRLGL